MKGRNWAAELRLQIAANLEIIRQLTDEELAALKERLQQDLTANLKAEAVEILSAHQRARVIGRDMAKKFE